MKRRENLFASLAAFASLTGFASLCYAQVCDTTSPGTNATTDGWEHNVDADYDGVDDPDADGGCNLGDPTFSELGTLSVGATRRITGVVGNYTTSTGGNSRDLDWIRFKLTSPCYIKLSVSMSKDGAPFSVNNTPPTQSVVFVAQGPDTSDATVYCGDTGASFFYGAALTTDCPQVVSHTFPNGDTKSTVPMPAGLHMVVVTTPFDAATYPGPIDYAVDLQVLALDNAVCGTSSNDCTAVNTTPGCSDAACCDTVCNLTPACCTVAWDAGCIDQGVTECGLFVYSCNPGTGAPPNDCAGASELVDASLLPLTFGFDASAASNDGPNDVNTLCSSNTTRDVWYTVGPLPYDGELRATMCGQGNTGDAVLSMYDIGTDSALSAGADLPSYYIGCRDDVCDDDGDGQLDLGGPAGLTMIGVSKDHYIMLRLGTFLDAGQDPADPTIAGLTGSLSVSFRATVYTNGLQQAVAKSDGTSVNLGWISGYASPTNPKRWMFVPATTTENATIDGYDFTAFDSGAGATDQVNFKLIARDSASSDHGAFGRPFGNGLFDASAVLAEGTEPFNIDAYADVGDRYGQRYFVTLSTPFELAAGDYYFTTFASNSEGGDESFAWLSYGLSGIPGQVLSTTANTTASDVPTTAYTGFPYGWRTVGSVPTVIAYQVMDSETTPTYTTQAGDDPGLTYQPAFSLKGSLANACFGDIDGSGEVDNGDVAFTLLDYGPCPGCPSDLDGTGEVDFGDVALILLSTGPCG